MSVACDLNVTNSSKKCLRGKFLYTFAKNHVQQMPPNIVVIALACDQAPTRMLPMHERHWLARGLRRKLYDNNLGYSPNTNRNF